MTTAESDGYRLYVMAMRTDCRHFESRTFANGDAVRSCKLGLAPEAPWRCPDPCAKFDRRSMDVGWTHGTMVTPAAPSKPSSLDDGSAAAILGEAASIIDSIAADVLRDMDTPKGRRRKNKKRKDR